MLPRGVACFTWICLLPIVWNSPAANTAFAPASSAKVMNLTPPGPLVKQVCMKQNQARQHRLPRQSTKGQTAYPKPRLRFVRWSCMICVSDTAPNCSKYPRKSSA